MIRTKDSATETLTFKTSTKELNALKLLATAERLTLSAFIRAALADRIHFELSIGNETLINQTENKPNAARIASPAEPVGKEQTISDLPHGPQTPTDKG